MSEALDLTPPDDEEPDALALSALLSSRVCHDLINPVGAVGSGLEVLDDPVHGRRHAGRRHGSHSNRAPKKRLRFFPMRALPMGPLAALARKSVWRTLKKRLQGVFDTQKANLEWNLGADLAAKENVKVLLILAYAAADCVPRGGDVVRCPAIST